VEEVFAFLLELQRSNQMAAVAKPKNRHKCNSEICENDRSG